MSESTKYKELFVDFANRTTHHGIAHAADLKSHIVKKVLWFSVILLVYSGFILTTWTYVSEYVRYDYVVTTKIEHADHQKLPAITFCNMNWMKLSSVVEQYPISHELFSEGEFVFQSNYTEILSHRYSQYEINRELSSKFFDMLINTTESARERFIGCRFNMRQQVQDCTPYLSTFLTEYGICHTFHSQEAIRRAGGAIYKSHNGITASTLITVNVNPDEYYLTPVNAEGMLVHVHDPDTAPYLDSDAFMVSPGTSLFIGIHKVRTLRLDEPYTNGCMDKKDDPGYSTAQCLVDCVLGSYYQSCDCSPLDSGPNGCAIDDGLRCIMFEFFNKTPVCSCKPMCEEVTYSYTAKSAKFPNLYGRNTYRAQGWPTNNRRELESKYAEVYVYFTTLDTEVVTHVPVVTTTQMVSSIGGLVGLFLGASIITVFECVELSVLLLAKRCPFSKKENTKVTSIKLELNECPREDNEKENAENRG